VIGLFEEEEVALKTVVVYGSVRSKRQGIKAARFVKKALEKRGHEVALVDPAERQLPILDKMYKEYTRGEAPEVFEELAGLYREADAFVFVTGEYNHSVPPALTNLIDHFMNEYFWRPAGIVSYSAGQFGGVRAAVHLRTILGEVGMVTIPSMFPVSKVQAAFDNDGNAVDDAYPRKIQRFLDELEWYANALKSARQEGVPYE
jgi:NAD(P)H-dependent FMN reductase